MTFFFFNQQYNLVILRSYSFLAWILLIALIKESEFDLNQSVATGGHQISRTSRFKILNWRDWVQHCLDQGITWLSESSLLYQKQHPKIIYLPSYPRHQKHQNLPGQCIKLCKVQWVPILLLGAECITVELHQEWDFQSCCYLRKSFHGLWRSINLKLGVRLDI